MMSKKILDRSSNETNIKDFLSYHSTNADGRPSLVNPSLTKREYFEIVVAIVTRGDALRVKDIMIDNLTREFGRYYDCEREEIL